MLCALTSRAVKHCFSRAQLCVWDENMDIPGYATFSLAELVLKNGKTLVDEFMGVVVFYVNEENDLKYTSIFVISSQTFDIHFPFSDFFANYCIIDCYSYFICFSVWS